MLPHKVTAGNIVTGQDEAHQGLKEKNGTVVLTAFST